MQEKKHKTFGTLGAARAVPIFPRTRNPIGPEGLAWAYMVDLAKTALPQATRKT